MLLKLTTVVNFAKILRVAFALIFKSTKLKCKYKKAAHKTFAKKAACKMLVKLTLGECNKREKLQLTFLREGNLVIFQMLNLATCVNIIFVQFAICFLDKIELQINILCNCNFFMFAFVAISF
jgi:hypothetical protein